MTDDRALFWIATCALMALGLLVGQAMAVSVAAAAGAVLVYDRFRRVAA